MFGPMILVALPELMQEPSPATKGESNDGGGRSEKGVTGGSESFLTYDNAEVVQNILYHEFKIEVSNFYPCYLPSIWMCSIYLFSYTFMLSRVTLHDCVDYCVCVPHVGTSQSYTG